MPDSESPSVLQGKEAAPETVRRPMDKCDLRQALSSLFSSQRLAVLSTLNGDQPYTSLVAFDASPDLDRFYFFTPETTRKFENLKANPRVSVLVTDSRNREDDLENAMAVTGLGRAEVLDRERSEAVLSRYLEKHPAMAPFSRKADSAFICIQMDRYVVVQKFQDVVEWIPE